MMRNLNSEALSFEELSELSDLRNDRLRSRVGQNVPQGRAAGFNYQRRFEGEGGPQDPRNQDD